MEHKKLLKQQHGYLLIVSILIMVIISVVATMLINMFGGSIKSTENISESNSAFYLATSGLQIAKRDIIELDKKCTDITGETLYTNATLSDIRGRYTIQAYINRVSSTLNGALGVGNTPVTLLNIVTASSTIANALTATSNTITIADSEEAKQFAVLGGIVKIGNEYIFYNERIDNVLNNLIRGVEGSSASAHSAGATLSQGFLNSGVIGIDKRAIVFSMFSCDTS